MAFWFFFICLIVMIGGIHLIAAAASRRAKFVFSSTAFMASVVILLKGSTMAVGWQIPFLDQPEKVAHVVRSLRGVEAVTIAALWPYFLAVIGAVFGFMYGSLLYREISN